jgi:hypothetical protein
MDKLFFLPFVPFNLVKEMSFIDKPKKKLNNEILPTPFTFSKFNDRKSRGV